MYADFYGLTADPFRLRADHRFCYSHRSYARAKAYVQYALDRAEGFVMVTGRPGTGKTTLVYDLLASLPNREVVAATLVSTQLEAKDLLLTTGHAFGLDFPSTQKALVLQRLSEFLSQQHRQGLRTLLIIDEAQDLAPSALEELRLLTNLNLDGEPLLQIVLLGQESLRDIVRQRAMEQVHQRLIAAWRLEPLSPAETIGYVRHRLEHAGWRGNPAFEPGVLPIVHAFSAGIPRRINLVCSRLLLHGCISELHNLTAEHAQEVTRELHEEELALPDYESDSAAPEALDPAQAETQEQHAAIWAEIDHGLFWPPEGQKPLQAEAADATTAPSPEPRAPDPLPAATETAGQPAPPPPAAAGMQDEQGDEPTAHLAPELDEHWRNVRTQPDPGPGRRARDRTRSRRGPWLVVLLLIGLVVGAFLVAPRGVQGDSAMRSLQQWWAATLDAGRNAIGPFVGRSAEDGSRQALDAPISGAELSDLAAGPVERLAPAAARPEPLELSPAIPESAPAVIVTVAEEPPPVPSPSPSPPRPMMIPTTPEEWDTPPLPPPPEDALTGLEPGAGAVVPADAADPPRSAAPPIDAAESSTTSSEALPSEPPPSTPVLTGRMYFRVNSTTIDPQFEPVLADIVDALAQSDVSHAEVIGYTDARGVPEQNLILSRRRAEAVADRLIAEGIDSSRLHVEGLGPRDGDADAGTGSLQRDRMVEITVWSRPRD